ncbi:MAG TPA: biotin/lipoyl-containing protein [Candidatus Limnocylindrales bacterium]|nr:biotin/lipoyl-containing protein [Candidatus Limnocylindrales bacterium]
MTRDRAPDHQAGPDMPADGSGGRDDDPQTIARVADELLPLLAARLGSSSLGELEVRRDGWRVRLRRGVNGASDDGQPAARRAQAGSRPGHGERRGESGGSGEPEDGPRHGRRERGRRAVTSPAVGYYQPRDGLSVGMNVRGGDLLGHVEVLGVRQDVVAPEDGIIVVLAAQPGEAVEYGQPLVRLEPESRS